MKQAHLHHSRWASLVATGYRGTSSFKHQCRLVTAHICLKCHSRSLTPAQECRAAFCGRVTCVTSLFITFTVNRTLFRKNVFRRVSLEAWLAIILQCFIYCSASLQQQMKCIMMLKVLWPSSQRWNGWLLKDTAHEAHGEWCGNGADSMRGHTHEKKLV